ncbi:hypothetical protein IMG5_061190 [Ichthyophthirius multifiliis]|uniref:D-lactate dehydrogenase n=1 Tax=Ichthyophthirius multifiliis TaxID=5932 RepID=G0QNS9_ICHMU|nr:hypothetical protein IMG5_061190 [Ichthyophthirius multifiliis]EGR33120.1 hypothetical protein IMG5_061190 [Ichthyophthirius multifiliis]|eukprot:XP_004037106.1 hypothetical protein IMG5_061190 [Ichthyophthirius multifiliis]
MLRKLQIFKNFCTYEHWQNKNKVALFSSKSYDQLFFEKVNNQLPKKQRLEIEYFPQEINEKTAILTQGFNTIIPFVNDKLNAKCLTTLKNNGVDLIALRCAGFNNIDLKKAQELDIKVVRVPAYSPQAVAEHTMALLLTLVRKIHKAQNRTKEGNFCLEGLLGINLYQKKVGVIGTGKIGQAFMQICKGFEMNILCYDVQSDKKIEEKYNAKYVDLKTLLQQSDIISLHCPLNYDTQYIIDRKSLELIKEGAYILNTGRGKLIRTDEIINSLKSGKLGGVGIDVFENEENFFFQDSSEKVINDDDLARLLMYPNVIVTGHQAFFTQEAINAICQVTVNNILQIRNNEKCENQIFYKDDRE